MEQLDMHSEEQCDHEGEGKDTLLVVLMLNGLLVERHFVKSPSARSHTAARRYPRTEYKGLKPDFAIQCHTHQHRVYVRPSFREQLLPMLREKPGCQVVIWSDEEKKNMTPVLEELFGHPQRIMLKMGRREGDKLDGGSVLFNLEKLWSTPRAIEQGFGPHNTVFIAPKSKAGRVKQKKNLITVPDYVATKRQSDNELLHLTRQLQRIVATMQASPDTNVRSLLRS
jgi:hypothetical protein